jgi:aminoglycoside phosphotransferase (APT) family kinase protein
VHALLRHLDARGFGAAPKVVGGGFDEQGRETLTYIEGDFVHGRPPWDIRPESGAWGLEAGARLGSQVRQFHDAAASFRPPAEAQWFEWSGEEMGSGERLIGHRDLGPWNIVACDGMPVGFIDWEHAGPVNPLVELAMVCWMNAKLYDDLVAERERLPPLEQRARLLRAIVDGYELPERERGGFIDLVIEVAVHSVAEEADEFDVRFETTSQKCPPELVWAMAWRGRSAAWIIKHRRVLESAL